MVAIAEPEVWGAPKPGSRPGSPPTKPCPTGGKLTLSAIEIGKGRERGSFPVYLCYFLSGCTVIQKYLLI